MQTNNNFGEGLVVFISCKPTLTDNWLSFASWYSVKKFLPDAQIYLVGESQEQERMSFGWVYRSKLPFVRSGIAEAEKLIQGEKVVIKAGTIAVREYLSGQVIPAKSLDTATFVDASQECGSLVISQWNRPYPPFRKATKFITETATPNERKVLSLWEESINLYLALQ